MRQINLPEYSKHIDGCISDLKSKSKIIDVGEILASLQQTYPSQPIKFEDIGEVVLKIASRHNVALVLPGQTRSGDTAVA